MAEDNVTLAAQAALENGEVDEDSKSRIKSLLEIIKTGEETSAALDEERNALKERARENSEAIQDAYNELLKVMPANPLGNLTIGEGAPAPV